MKKKNFVGLRNFEMNGTPKLNLLYMEIAVFFKETPFLHGYKNLLANNHSILMNISYYETDRKFS